ncbi:hypothetical protein EV142_102117 [Flavobacterium circumlabens]|uniref:Uncharacterized protein n=1 Tax=Flavobacterium circumlabens TaxID=2133765 RepID=A0ABY2B1V0_9FLAO|nr:hypothetical protein EV142_102117 [Flavobacterium circumlabens]
MNNITPSINQKRTLKLYNSEGHPICLLKKVIQLYFKGFELFDSLSEVLTIFNNFGELIIPADHPANLS